MLAGCQVILELDPGRSGERRAHLLLVAERSLQDPPLRPDDDTLGAERPGVERERAAAPVDLQVDPRVARRGDIRSGYEAPGRG